MQTRTCAATDSNVFNKTRQGHGDGDGDGGAVAAISIFSHGFNQQQRLRGQQTLFSLSLFFYNGRRRRRRSGSKREQAWDKSKCNVLRNLEFLEGYDTRSVLYYNNYIIGARRRCIIIPRARGYKYFKQVRRTPTVYVGIGRRPLLVYVYKYFIIPCIWV